MDQPTATLAAGIAASAVATISTILSYLALRSQQGITRDESERSRSTQRSITILPKLLSALEDLWELLYTIESVGGLSQQESQRFIRAALWAPEHIRVKCLLALGGDPDDKMNASNARAALDKYVNSLRPQL